MKNKDRLIIDGHLHIYDDYDLDLFFDRACANIDRATGETGRVGHRVLLLTEGKEKDFFTRFKDKGVQLNDPQMEFQHTRETCSLVLSREGTPMCYILRGRQIVTRENLEVLAPATETSIPDGQPIRQVLDRLLEKGDIAVLAWGVGKWFLSRGKVVAGILRDYDSPYLFVGDNSARAVFWPRPGLYKQAIRSGFRVINGSDPLPLAGEEKKAGAYGFILEGKFDPQYPAASFKKILLETPGPIPFFGHRDGPVAFFSRQARMFLHKHLK